MAGGVTVNIDGLIGAPEEMRISALDRGFLYGDSVYEVVRTYGGVPFALGEHLERLARSAERLAIRLPERGRLVRELRRTLAVAGHEDAYCRIVVTRGSGPITLDPTTATTPLTVILVKRYEPYPEWTYERGVRVAIPQIRRTSPRSLDPAIKSGNYLNSVLALGEARAAGCDDALMLDGEGNVTEATSSNVFIVRDDAVSTPALEIGLLAGVTRGVLIDLLAQTGSACSERALTVKEVTDADEVMLTSTLREVQPVVEVAGRRIGEGVPGPMAKRLKALFHDHALQRVRREAAWDRA
jgi:branched-chain amino acid aminotransferase